MKKAIITIGVSGSGKTFWAEKFCLDNRYVNINRDDIRREMFGFGQWAEYKFTRAKEDAVTKHQRNLMLSAYDEDVSGIVVSDTNLNQAHRARLIEFLVSVGYEVETKIFDISLKQAIKNDLNREHSVGREVIYRQWKQYQTEFGVKPIKQDENNPRAIIVDVDGTLAEMVDRTPYEWSKVGQDNPNKFLIEMLNRMSRDHIILVVSGRDGSCYQETADWLRSNGLIFSQLFTRAKDDKRPDTVVKREIYMNHINDYYNVVAVFDDRPKVITETWLPLGLKTYTLGDFNIDF